MPTPRLIHLDQTTSTMDEARQRATALAADATHHPAASNEFQQGILITARTQTQGRGTQARPWHSPPGMLMGTYLRSIREPNPPVLTLRTALAIARLAEQWLLGTAHPPIRIKWPNDILLGDAKLAGVLIELISLPNPAPCSTAILIGVGLNANNPPPPLPPDARPAASLSNHRAEPLNLTLAAQQLAEALTQATDHPQTPLNETEVRALNDRLHAQGQPALIRTTSSSTPPKTPATIDAINADGTLRVLINNTPRHITRTADIIWPMNPAR